MKNNTTPPVFSGSSNNLSSCPVCGAQVECGVELGENHCWCFELPPATTRPDLAPGDRCLCRACLLARRAQVRGESKK